MLDAKQHQQALWKLQKLHREEWLCTSQVWKDRITSKKDRWLFEVTCSVNRRTILIRWQHWCWANVKLMSLFAIKCPLCCSINDCQKHLTVRRGINQCSLTACPRKSGPQKMSTNMVVYKNAFFNKVPSLTYIIADVANYKCPLLFTV